MIQSIKISVFDERLAKAQHISGGMSQPCGYRWHLAVLAMQMSYYAQSK